MPGIGNAFGLQLNALAHRPSPPGQAPVANDDAFIFFEDGSYVVNLFGNNGNGVDFDPNGDTFRVSSVNGTALIGSLSTDLLSSDGITYHLVIDANGNLNIQMPPQANNLSLGQTDTISFTYQLSDKNGFASAAPANVIVTILGTNDGPVLQSGHLNSAEDGPAVSLNLATLGDDLDSDDDGSTLIYSVVNQPTGGLVTIQGTTLIFDPGKDFQNLAAGQTLDLTFDVAAMDRHGALTTNQITITVSGADERHILLTGWEGGPNGWNPVGAVGSISGTPGITQTEGGQSLLLQGAGATQAQIEASLHVDIPDDVVTGSVVSRTYFFHAGDVISFDFRMLGDSASPPGATGGFYIDPNAGIVQLEPSGFVTHSFQIHADGEYTLAFGTYCTADAVRDLSWGLLDNLVLS